MIEEVVIKDINKSTISYLPDIGLFNDVTSFKFKPGINIIVGKNGCGKSTLLNIISDYALCRDKMYSDLDIIGDFKAINYEYLFDHHDASVMDGVEVKCDYSCKVFKYLNKYNMDKHYSMSSIENLSIAISNNSTGENIIGALGVLFNTLFNSKDYEFPINKIKEIISSNRINDYWSDRLSNLLRYYKSNQISIKENEITILMDEPDRNLDIDNIEDLYNTISYRKDQIQTIVVVHNPLLIYKLSKLDYINFIELTEGYIDKINHMIRV